MIFRSPFCIFLVRKVKAVFKKLKLNCFEKGNAAVKIQKYGDCSWKDFFRVGQTVPVTILAKVK
jgi:hypothetical protein